MTTTTDRINRGQYRLMIVQHGEGGKNREIQVVDMVEGCMVKGVTEKALIAHILLPQGAASKGFGGVSAVKDLAKAAARKDKTKYPTGIQRVIAENEGLRRKPKTRKPWPKMRAPKTAAEIQAEGIALQKAEDAREYEASLDVVATADDAVVVVKEGDEEGTVVVVDEGSESAVAEAVEKDPTELAGQYEFKSPDSEGLFIAMVTAFGGNIVEKWLFDYGELKEPICDVLLEAMGEDLSASHVPGDKVEVVDETTKKPKKQAPRKKKAKTFNPKKAG